MARRFWRQLLVGGLCSVLQLVLLIWALSAAGSSSSDSSGGGSSSSRQRTRPGAIRRLAQASQTQCPAPPQWPDLQGPGGPTPTCQACSLPSLDQCRFDFSLCTALPPGASCKVQCRSPFVGGLATALCPANGTADGQGVQLDMTPLQCMLAKEGLECYDPLVEPEGYVRDTATGTWSCAPGFLGRVERTCVVGQNCQLEALFLGCGRPTACQNLEDEPQADTESLSCEFDTSSCRDVQPGASCSIGCRSPYVGVPTVATCPQNNTDPARRLQRTWPACQLNCPDPWPPPTGYVQRGTDLVCGGIYAGTVQKNCTMHPGCNIEVNLSGCAIPYCSVPSLEGSSSCRYDLDGCQNRLPGESCDVRCREPFYGAATQARCPDGQSTPGQPLQVQFPSCGLRCPLGNATDMGYVQDSNGFWRCADGFVGFARVICSLRETDCVAQLDLQGCNRLASCLLPTPPTGAHGCTMVNLSKCSNPVPGTTCDLQCQPPYSGTTTQGVCPEGNTLPGLELRTGLGLPVCTAAGCEDPIPAGYMKTSVGWTCAPGYAGRALTSCSCSGDLLFRGCVAITRCTAPQLIDTCRHNASSCAGGVPAGKSCEVTCTNMFEGEAELVTCPADNMDPDRLPDYQVPNCTVACAKPDPPPRGYTATSDGWTCAENYVGQPVSSCSLLEEDCLAELTLSGCRPLVPCMSPVVDENRRDTSSCTSLHPNQTCELPCRPPYVGAPARARCPADNVNRARAAEVLPAPECRLRCDLVPDGYEKGLDGWRCAEGYAGEVNMSCAATSETEGCRAALSLQGCRPLTHCLAPARLDPCSVNISDCMHVTRGDSCMLQCLPPFTGEPVFAYCPENNTDKDSLQWAAAALSCTLPGCDEPQHVPAGYREAMPQGTGWVCAENYIGTAVKRCRVDPQDGCRVEGVLEGCLELHPCPYVEGDRGCMTTTNCSDGLAPGNSCQLRCRWPYSGPDVNATCPHNNSDASRALPLPNCVLDCPATEPVLGYVKTDGMWHCDHGYSGQAQVDCSVDTQCNYQVTFSGCEALVPCHDPVVQDCRVDVTDCVAVLPGSNCSLRCAWPYTGQSTIAACPVGGAVPGQLQDLATPQCILDQCPDPNPAPPRFAKNGVGWHCAEGYGGTAILDCTPLANCSVQSWLHGCEPLIPCLRMVVDECRINMTECPQPLGPGQNCTPQCRTPLQAVRQPTPASCPAGNTNSSQHALWSPLECQPPVDLECPEPTQPPTAYAWTSQGWECAQGSIGSAQASCQPVGQNCSLTRVLAGCSPLVACQLPTCEDDASNCSLFFEGFPDFEFDCRYNASGCSVPFQAGSFCQVLCKEPYAGTPGSLDCAADNIDPNRTSSFIPPECSAVCPDPVPTPVGYERTLSGWRCAEGYAGSLSASCQVNGTCFAELLLQGCEPLQPCANLTHEGCNFQSNCTGMAAGDSCELQCKSPLEGNSTVGVCPLENTNSETVVDHTLPDCSLPSCPNPAQLPAEYTLVAADTWQCSTGFAGTVTRTCVLDDTCATEAAFSGCLPLANCLPADERALDGCKYNVSACQTLAPGESCEIRCRSPFYVGNVGFGRCPADNTNPARGPAMSLPSCVTDCPLAGGVPAGYLRAADGWQCAAGYTGTATPSCSIEEYFRSSTGTTECQVELSLAGCVPLTPCVLPSLNPCTYDTSSCGDHVQPNSTCEIRCRDFHIGGLGNATCPAGNGDPTRLASLVVPTCTLDCPETDHPPSGYHKTGPFAWDCADGYVGEASIVSCDMGAGCVPDLVLSGCEEIVSCAPVPQITGTCEFDTRPCFEFASNRDCEVECMSPCSGGSTTISCPGNNTDPAQEMLGSLPQCVFECDRIPPGYARLEGQWHCATGYTGTVQESCTKFGGCEMPTLSGCDPVQPCAAPSTEEMCRLDYTACGDRAAGTSCEVTCRPPYYTGAPGVGECPPGNTDPLGSLIWSTSPGCAWVPSNDCVDPDLAPTGYSRTSAGEWICADGYAGNASRSCALKGELCQPEAELSGCAPLVPCKAPALGSCHYNTTECLTLSPGASCHIRCNVPFNGTPSVARCPADNTDPWAEPDYVAPHCALSCPDPDPMPVEYARTDGQWLCNAGYAGNLTAECIADSACQWEWFLSGCEPLVPCVDTVLNSTCAYNLTACVGVAPGSPCSVPCRSPYVPMVVDGVASVGSVTCPAGNIDPTTPVEVVLPQCSLDCTDPNPAPLGYAGPPFVCAPGYTGFPVKLCSTSSDCSTVLSTMTGCDPELPCLDLDVRSIDVCQYDVSACQGVPSGGSCAIDCRAPLVATAAGSATCPAQNRDLLAEMQVVFPECRAECPDSAVKPLGYVTQDGAWQCASGYRGTVNVACPRTGPTCEMQGPIYSGCEPLAPCAPLLTDPCSIDAVGCSQVDAGASCLVHCKPPFVGNSSVASCPADNVNPLQQLILDAPQCSLVCERIDPAPPGYVLLEAGWQCAEGYIGVAVESCQTNSQCQVITRLDGCVPLVPCVAPSLDPCVFNTSACMELSPGATCEVPCLLHGSSINGTCPANNVDPTTEWSFESQSCVPACPVPEPLPAGYQQGASGWECVEGYIGNATDSCTVGGDCSVADLLLQGCSSIVPCANLTINTCLFNVSACEDPLPPNTSCEVLCMEPTFTGSLGMLSCPAENVDAARAPDWSPAMCRLSQLLECPPPHPMPAGYVHNGSGWECAHGYAGHAMETCLPTGPNCTLEAHLSGCQPLVACARPCLDTSENCSDFLLAVEGLACRYNTLACVGLLPNTSCVITCQGAFVGMPGSAMCPEDNTDPQQQPITVLPDCTVECSHTEVPPLGYVQDPMGWACSEGALGRPNVTCLADEDCENSRLHFAGCFLAPNDTNSSSGCADNDTCSEPTHQPPGEGQPCATLDLNATCDLHAVNCSIVPAGEFCLVECKAPYTGQGGVATCPAGNQDPTQELILVTPACDCREPDPVPLGYELMQSGYTCAAGYAGRAMKTCVADATCEVQPVLSGCALVVPCPSPVVDSCRFDISACPIGSLQPGSECEVRCQAAGIGNAVGVARCPANNTNPLGGLQWMAPACEAPVCVDPVPPGFMKTELGWQCAEGYAGTPVLTCDANARCNAAEYRFSGCAAYTPCQPPDLSDVCAYDVSNCSDLAPNTSCEVRCRAPYAGNVIVARCPAGNVNQSQRAVLETTPACSLTCAEPANLPDGYARAPDGAWSCAVGYSGIAQANCVQLPSCGARLEFTGCSRLFPCTGLDNATLSDLSLPSTNAECVLDLGPCSGPVSPGSNCDLRCRPPFSGVAGRAACPADNTQPDTALQLLTQPVCGLPSTCGEPASLDGYVNGSDGWQCSAGYAGAVAWDCNIDSVDCSAGTVLRGCKPVVPCLPFPDTPVPGSSCPYVVSGCTATTCTLSCPAPFVGSSGTATCPADNTDPQLPFSVGVAPACQCPDPDPAQAPPGYILAGAGWTCAAGFLGRAERTCACGAAASEVQGCLAPVPCGAAGFGDIDIRNGVISGYLEFGPALVGGELSETGVVGYAVFAADPCGQPVGEALATVPLTTTPWSDRCCRTDAYRVLIVPTQLIMDTSWLLVAARTSSGVSPRYLNVSLVDLSVEDVNTPYVPVGIHSGAQGTLALAVTLAIAASALFLSLG